MRALLLTWLTVAGQFSGGVMPFSLGITNASAADSQSALTTSLAIDFPVQQSPWGVRAGLELFSDHPPLIGYGDLELSSFSGWGAQVEVERLFPLGPDATAYLALGALSGQLWAGWFLTGNAPVCPANVHDVYEDCTSFTRGGVFPRLSLGARVDWVEFGTDFTYARMMGVGVKMFSFRLGVRVPFG